MTKQEVRRAMRQRLDKLDSVERAEASQKLRAMLAHEPAWKRSTCVALFAPLPSEPAIEARWTDSAQRFCFPRVIGETLRFFEITSPDELLPALWNSAVREPAADPARLIAPHAIDLILVPGLAFTRDGQRLGRGGGFYDRFLTELRPDAVKIGVCFDRQIVATLPAESHDQRVDRVTTETNTFDASRRA